MGGKPEISILIANYNNGHFFKDALLSLLRQTIVDWEAIVIDDGSTDNSVEVIRNLIRSDKRFRVYQNQVNLGYQKTISHAISLSRAELFGRLDPDDALHPEALELSVKAHHNFPEVGLVYSNIVYCDRNLQPTAILKGRQIEDLDESSYNLEGTIWPFATFKKDIYDKTSGIDVYNRRAEDQDIYLKMCEMAPVKYIDRETYYYRIHDQGASTMENRDKAFFWQWVALIKMAERREKNIEDLFNEYFAEACLLNIFKQRRKNLFAAIDKNRILSMFAYLAGKKN